MWLRLITPDDAPLHVRLSNDPDVRRFLGGSLNLTESRAADGLRRANSAMGLYVIESIADGKPIGYCGFVPNRDIPEIDMLISLLPEHQGHNFGDDVLEMLKSVWLDRLGNEECFATVRPENARATKLLEAHGFIRVRQYLDFFEQLHDVYKASR